MSEYNIIICMFIVNLKEKITNERRERIFLLKKQKYLEQTNWFYHVWGRNYRNICKVTMQPHSTKKINYQMQYYNLLLIFIYLLGNLSKDMRGSEVLDYFLSFFSFFII